METKILVLGNEKISDSRENRELVWSFIKTNIGNYPYENMPRVFDWNYLLPIIGKINSLNLKNSKLGAIKYNLDYFVVSYKIEGAWKNLLQFILEYNITNNLLSN